MSTEKAPYTSRRFLVKSGPMSSPRIMAKPPPMRVKKMKLMAVAKILAFK